MDVYKSYVRPPILYGSMVPERKQDEYSTKNRNMHGGSNMWSAA